MERPKCKVLSEKQKDLILSLHKFELTSRQIAEVAQCAQSTVIRHLQKFQETGQLPMTERRKSTRGPTCSRISEAGLSINYQGGNIDYTQGLSNVVELKAPTHEQIYLRPRDFARLNYPNMMEVKHSPSSQMDFRTTTTTNGLPTEEDEDMDTLLEEEIGKNDELSSNESETNKPILNGISKHTDDENPSKNLDGMEIDLLEDEMEDEQQETPEVESCESKKEDEETEGPKEDIDLYELDLEEVVTDKAPNGEITDASALRDTGDDLDTLLSKINDLVEDCMDAKTGKVPATGVIKEVDNDNDVVEILDDEVEDLPEDAADVAQSDELLEEESLKETPQEKEIQADTEVEETVEKSDSESEPVLMQIVKGEETIEEQVIDGVEEVDSSKVKADETIEEELKELTDEESIKGDSKAVSEELCAKSPEDSEKEKKVENLSVDVSEEKLTEKMDVDDDADEIVCLDSPVPIEDKKVKDSVNNKSPEEATPQLLVNEKDEKSPETKEETPQKQEEESPKEEQITEKPEKPVAEVQTPMEDDDEIFLIEDDEDEEEPEKQSDIPAKSQKEKAEEPKVPEETEKLPAETGKETAKPVDEKEDKTAVPSDKTKEDAPVEDDDDIVCLDDSIEETEEEDKSETVVEKAETEKNEKTIVEDKEEQTHATPETVTEKPAEEAEKVTEEKLVKEPVKDGSEKEEQQATEEVAVDKNVQEVLKEDVVLDKNIETSDKVEKQDEKEVILEKAVESAPAIIEEERSDKAPAAEEVQPAEPKAVTEPEKSSNITVDNDIITLDDEDDEEMPSSENKNEKSSAIAPENKQQDQPDEAKETPKSVSTISSDNSDNARDGVEEKEEKNEAKASAAEEETPIQSEANSNSSNLLKESAHIEQEETRSEPSEQPPAKRIRLSQDEANSRNSSASQDDTKSNIIDDDDVMEIVDKTDDDSKTLKRVHSSGSISSDFKKPKTDFEAEKVEEKDATKDEKADIKMVEPCKEEIVDKKPVEVKPLALYPPPNLEPPKISLSLDFLKRFKKSIHKMNKSDLEELVLQKIVEAIVHKSEFSEMRDLIEKQEKIISGHRTKITELNKQFRDLEMVHNRVLKDLETKNAQFIVPVKITRAVGLQVFFPNKKYDQPMAALNAAHQTQSPASSAARRVSTGTGTNGEKPSMTSSQTGTNTSPMTSIPSTGLNQNAPQQRRGCVQKLTPMRPDTPRNSPLNRAVASGVVSSSTPSPMTPKEPAPKILNKQVVQKPRLTQSPLVGNTTISTPPQQSTTPQPATPQPEPEKPKAPLIPQGIATKKTGPVRVNPPSKRIPKSWQSEPKTISLSPAGLNSTTSQIVPQPTPTAVAAPPKTPNKSVIDLTDEDDIVPSPSPRTPTVTTTPQQKPAATPSPNPPGQRVYKLSEIPTLQTSVTQKVTPAPHLPAHRPYKVSVIPAHQLQQPKANPPKQTAPRQPLPIAPRPNGTVQAAVRQAAPPNPVKYRHPAPLPTQPIHSSNPLWKLPPARPTIRISNLDSGIVISWTIEDTAKDKYAESTSYQIYAYQETSGPPLVESWRHVGDVKAMLLPMAVTLTQFQEGQRYYFAVRAVDAHNRCGPFSFAKTWS